MTREERLLLCGKCLHRTLDFENGYLCNLTGKVGEFENECVDFTRDGTVTENLKIRVRTSEKRTPVMKEPVKENTRDQADPPGRGQLNREALQNLRKYQSILYAMIGGLLGTLVIAIGWSVLAGHVNFPVIYLSLVVGLLVGVTIRFFGAGTWKLFGILGGLFTLLACFLGRYLIHEDLVGKVLSDGLNQAMTGLRPEMLASAFTDSFTPLDLVFYGLAILMGYLLSIRRIGAGKRLKLNTGEDNGAPALYRLRLPLIVAGILIPAILGYTQMNRSLGWTERYNDSGQKLAEGGMKLNGKSGEWTYWFENGNVMCRGYYVEGIRDSLWQWFDKEGRPTTVGSYDLGLEQGTWMHFFDNGLCSDSGRYADGYMEGTWKYWHENGALRMEGEMNRGKKSGVWKVYFDDGLLAEIWAYRENETLHVQDAWDPGGTLMVSGGNGFYKRFSDQGDLVETGEISNGLRTGIWTRYFTNGHPCEEGIYVDDRYLVLNSWSPDGDKEVADGNGTHHSYFKGTLQVSESGTIKNGAREGTWKSYDQESGKLKTESEYVSGVQTGLMKYFFESGTLMSSGMMVDGLREGEWNWFNEDGGISTTVTFHEGEKLEENLSAFILDLF